jgi:hypothetical protein
MLTRIRQLRRPPRWLLRSAWYVLLVAAVSCGLLWLLFSYAASSGGS